MVSELLGRGEEEAMEADTICYMMGMNRQELKEDIEKERIAGQPILRCFIKGEASYYLAGTPAELRKFCRLFGSMMPAETKAALLAGIYKPPYVPDYAPGEGGIM